MRRRVLLILVGPFDRCKNEPRFVFVWVTRLVGYAPIATGDGHIDSSSRAVPIDLHCEWRELDGCETRGCSQERVVQVEKVVLTPMVVHRNLAIHYQRRLVEGWTHDQAMKEIEQYCGLPVVWRGCLPFTGSFHPKRLLNAWKVNWTLWTLLLAWLASMAPQK